MLNRVNAIRFDKPVSSGKTKPCILGCEPLAGGQEVEVVAKFAEGCEMKHRSLMAEAISAMLAADLDLPVPEAFLVNVDSEFASTITDPASKGLAQKSLGWNFGSRKLPPGYSIYPKEKPLPQALLTTAAEIFAFDTFIANPDRTVANPNLLFNGNQMAIYDHELAFLTSGIIGWKPPWEPQGIKIPRGLPPGMRHVFQEELRGKTIDLSRFAGAFEALTPGRFLEYQQALPPEWLGDGIAVKGIISYITELKVNLEESINYLTMALQ